MASVGESQKHEFDTCWSQNQGDLGLAVMWCCCNSYCPSCVRSQDSREFISSQSSAVPGELDAWDSKLSEISKILSRQTQQQICNKVLVKDPICCCFSDNSPQGRPSVATHLRGGGIFYYRFSTALLAESVARPVQTCLQNSWLVAQIHRIFNRRAGRGVIGGFSARIRVAILPGTPAHRMRWVCRFSPTGGENRSP